MKPTMTSLCLCASLLLGCVPARAIELSLEENRAERGSVGYVDMQRLFKASPDATRAREGLEELVRQAEERVNARKAELLRLQQELLKLKSDREDVAKSTPTAAAPAKPIEAPKPVETPKPAVSTVPVTAAPLAAPSLPQRGAIPLPAAAATPVPAASTSTATTPPPLTINLPGLTDGPLNLEAPAAKTEPKVETKVEPKPEVKPAPVVSPVVVSTPTPPVQPAGPTIAQRLLEFDGLIVAKQADISRLQAEIDRERLGAERSLLDAEGRKTDQVLARLYRAISEVAKREGVSVVVDKSATLYGHPAVDLTDKILKQLKGPVMPP